MSSSGTGPADGKGKGKPSGVEASPPVGGDGGEASLRLEIHPRREGVPDCVPMSGEELIIGREEGDILIGDLLVSRRHAAITRGDDGAPVLRDLDSTNGTFLNGALLLGTAKLRDGDDIRIGPSHLRVRLGDD